MWGTSGAGAQRGGRQTEIGRRNSQRQIDNFRHYDVMFDITFHFVSIYRERDTHAHIKYPANMRASSDVCGGGYSGGRGLNIYVCVCMCVCVCVCVCVCLCVKIH